MCVIIRTYMQHDPLELHCNLLLAILKGFILFDAHVVRNNIFMDSVIFPLFQNRLNLPGIILEHPMGY